MCVPFYIGVPLLKYLSLHANNITDEAGIAAAAAPIGACRWDNRHKFSRHCQYELGMATHWLEGRWLVETSVPLRVDWFYPWLSLPSFFFQQWAITKYGETWLIWETIPSYGWLMKAPLQSVLFLHVSVLSILLKQIVTEATGLHSILVGFTWRNLSDWTWYLVPVSLILHYYELGSDQTMKAAPLSGGTQTMMRRIFKILIEENFKENIRQKAFHHWYMVIWTCFSQEHMQTFGYLISCFQSWRNVWHKEEQRMLCKPIRPLQHFELQLDFVDHS